MTSLSWLGPTFRSTCFSRRQGPASDQQAGIDADTIANGHQFIPISSCRIWTPRSRERPRLAPFRKAIPAKHPMGAWPFLLIHLDMAFA